MKGTVNGAAFRSSLMDMGEGHAMVVNAMLREAAECRTGDGAKVVMEEDRDQGEADRGEDIDALRKGERKR